MKTVMYVRQLITDWMRNDMNVTIWIVGRPSVDNTLLLIVFTYINC